MAMAINKLMVQEGPSIHYDPKFCRTLETYMDYLRKHPETQSVPINPHDAYKYEGDLISLLRRYQVPRHLHWVVMRMNEFTSTSDVKQDLQSLLVPLDDVVNNIRQLYLTTDKKRTS
jgi:hypothetical protein